MPGQPPEQLLECLICRFADGREIALAELPIAAVLTNAETMRAEEIEFSVPDGRSVTTLINATPIRGEDGAFVSVVVTMQDLAPLEDLERMRAGFLSMVSHELRGSCHQGSARHGVGGSRNFAQRRRTIFSHHRGAFRPHGSLMSELLDAAHRTGTLSVRPCLGGGGLARRARTTFLPAAAVKGGHRPAVGPPPGLGRPGAHRAGAEQPARQRRPVLA